MKDAGMPMPAASTSMPMPAASTSMPMPSYAYATVSDYEFGYC
jgi:hypothetical protein